MIVIIALIAGLLPLLPALALALKRRRQAPVKMTRRLVLGLSGLNLALALMMIGLGLVWLFAPHIVEASGLAQEAAADPYGPIAAAVSVSVGSIGAAYAVSTTGSAALGAIAEKPEIFGSAIIVVGLAEGVAIYGLIIAFIIISR